MKVGGLVAAGLPNPGSPRDLTALKVLNRSLVFPSCGLGLERAQIPTLSCFGILLPGIQPIFSGLEFPNHDSPFLAAIQCRFCVPRLNCERFQIYFGRPVRHFPGAHVMPFQSTTAPVTEPKQQQLRPLSSP
jgi:hypothetical protein